MDCLKKFNIAPRNRSSFLFNGCLLSKKIEVRNAKLLAFESKGLFFQIINFLYAFITEKEKETRKKKREYRGEWKEGKIGRGQKSSRVMKIKNNDYFFLSKVYKKMFLLFW